jgi:hypothetical protein
MDDADKHWREVLAQDQQKFERERRTREDGWQEKFRSDRHAHDEKIQDYKAQLAGQQVELENAITKSKEAIAKEWEEFEVKKTGSVEDALYNRPAV